MKKLIAILAVLGAALIAQAGGYDHRYDKDLDTIDDLFDACPDIYAQTRDGCPGSPPDTRTFTCADPIQIRPGLSVRNNILRVPLNRKFCWGDEGHLFVSKRDGAVELVNMDQHVPESEQYASSFRLDNAEVRVVSGAARGTSGQTYRQLRVTGVSWVRWDPDSKAVEMGVGQPPVGAIKPSTDKSIAVVDRQVLLKRVEAFRHRFDITAVEYVHDGARHGVKFSTTLGQLPVAVSTELFGPDSELPLEDKEGDFVAGYMPPKAFANTLIVPGQATDNDRRRAAETLKSMPYPGWLTVRFPHGICTFPLEANDDLKLGRMAAFARGEAKQRDPTYPSSLSMSDSYMCSIRLAVCADSDQPLGNPVVEPADDGTLTLWMDVPIAPSSSPCWNEGVTHRTPWPNR